MKIQDEFGCVLCEVQPENGRLFLGRAMLRRAQLKDCDLRGAVLSCADLRGANLDRADLAGALLDDADLTGASLRETRLAGANLLRARLADARLSGVDLRAAVLSSGPGSECPVLTGATIESCNLSEQRLDGDFSQVSFEGTDLSKSVLVGQLTAARFAGAILNETWLVSDFQFTSFADTDLSPVRRLTVLGKIRPLGPVRWNLSTKWPPGLPGYWLAYRLMTWDELHPGWSIIASCVLVLLLRASELVHSWVWTALWVGLITLAALALRVVYVRRRKEF